MSSPTPTEQLVLDAWLSFAAKCSRKPHASERFRRELMSKLGKLHKDVISDTSGRIVDLALVSDLSNRPAVEEFREGVSGHLSNMLWLLGIDT